jgi:hypothetical protein
MTSGRVFKPGITMEPLRARKRGNWCGSSSWATKKAKDGYPTQHPLKVGTYLNYTLSCQSCFGAAGGTVDNCLLYGLGQLKK